METKSLLAETAKKTLWHSLIYGIGTSFTAFVGIVLMPLYTRFLKPEEYGVYSLISVAFTLLVFIYDFGMINALFRWVYHYDENEKAARKRVVSTVLFFLLALSATLTCILWNQTANISRIIFKTADFSGLIRLMLIGLFLQSLTWVPFSLIRINEKPFIFTAIVMLGMVTMVSANFILLSRGKALTGIYEAYIISCAVMAAPLYYITRNEYALAFSFGELKGMFAFALPFFPVLFFAWVIDFSGRYFLGHFSTLQQVGLYSAGYKIGQILYLAEKTFAVAWTPIMLSLSQRYMERAPDVFGRVFTYFVFSSFFLVIGVSIFAREIMRIFTTPAYYAATQVVPLIAIAYLLYGVYVFMLSGLIITKNVYAQPLILLSAAVINVMLNILLIPKFGMVGSAYATIAGYFIAAAATFYFSQKFYPIPVEAGRIGKIVITSGLICYASRFFSIQSLVVSVFSKAALLILFFFILYFIRFFTVEETARLKAFIRRC